MSRSGLREALANVAVGCFYLLFASAHLAGFAQSRRPSLALMFLLETVAAALFVTRSRATRASVALYSWMITAGGTLTPLLLRPDAGDGDVLVGQAVQYAGTAFAVASLLSLSRSFGLLPAVRKIRVNGTYRWVRHPLYAAYTVQGVGYLISNFTLQNVVVVILGLAFQVARIHDEERLLVTDPAYDDYRKRTPWRLIPLVF